MPLKPAPSDPDDLVAELLTQAEREKRWWRVRQFVTVALFINYAASFLVADLLPIGSVKLYRIISVFLFVFGGSAFGLLLRPTRGQQQTVERLMNSELPHTVGALTEAYAILLRQRYYTADLCKTASPALADRLNELTWSDGERWTSAQRAALRDILRSSSTVSVFQRDVMSFNTSYWNRQWLSIRDGELTLAVLGAIARIGDKDDLDVVAAVAGAETRDEKSEEVRVAAERCLAALEARVDEQRKGETLLRPSESAESVLLRAASPSSSLEEEQTLLRPGEQS